MTLEIPDTNAVEEGIYPAVLTKIDLKTTDAGDTFRIWSFDVTANGETKKITSSSSMMLGPKSKAYKWVSALLGRRPAPGDKIEVVGLPCQLHLIVDEDTGYYKVESVLPAGGSHVLPPPQPAAPAASQPMVAAAPAPQGYAPIGNEMPPLPPLDVDDIPF